MITNGRCIDGLGPLTASVANAQKNFSHDVTAGLTPENLFSYGLKFEGIDAYAVWNLVSDPSARRHENFKPREGFPQGPMQFLEPLFFIGDSTFNRKLVGYGPYVPAQLSTRLQVVGNIVVS